MPDRSLHRLLQEQGLHAVHPVRDWPGCLILTDGFTYRWLEEPEAFLAVCTALPDAIGPLVVAALVQRFSTPEPGRMGASSTGAGVTAMSLNNHRDRTGDDHDPQ